MLFAHTFVLAALFALSITFGQASPIAGAVAQRAPWDQQPVCEKAASFKYGPVWDQLWALRRTLCSGKANFVSLRGYDIDQTVSFKENGKTRYINVKWKSYLHENHGEQGYPDCYVSFLPVRACPYHCEVVLTETSPESYRVCQAFRDLDPVGAAGANSL